MVATLQKFSLLILLLTFVFPVMAQPEKGSFMIGGSGGFSYKKEEFLPANQSNYQEISTTQTFNLGPSIGYFINDNLVAGLSFTFLRERVDQSQLSGNKSLNKQFTVGPIIKYYFKNGLFASLEAGIGPSNLTISNQLEAIELKWTAVSGRVGIGYAVFLSKYIALEPLVSFQHNAVRGRGGSDWEFSDSNISVGLGLNVFVGN